MGGENNCDELRWFGWQGMTRLRTGGLIEFWPGRTGTTAASEGFTISQLSHFLAIFTIIMTAVTDF